jgi:hypothetical protein
LNPKPKLEAIKNAEFIGNQGTISPVGAVINLNRKKPRGGAYYGRT